MFYFFTKFNTFLLHNFQPKEKTKNLRRALKVYNFILREHPVHAFCKENNSQVVTNFFGILTMFAFIDLTPLLSYHDVIPECFVS